MQVIKVAVRCALVAAVAVTGGLWLKSLVIGPTTAATRYECLPPFKCDKQSDEQGTRSSSSIGKTASSSSSSGSSSDTSGTSDTSNTVADSSNTEGETSNTAADSSSTNDSDSRVDWDVRIN